MVIGVGGFGGGLGLGAWGRGGAGNVVCEGKDVVGHGVLTGWNWVGCAGWEGLVAIVCCFWMWDAGRLVGVGKY